MTKLFIKHLAAEKIRQYTALCPNEISGIGKVVVEEGVLTVTDVEIFKQKVSSAHSTIEPEALAEFQMEKVKAGETMKDYKFWWHSHANMGVFFSGTDTDTIEHSSEFPYLVSLVVNKKGDAKARLDYYTPIHGSMELTVETEKAPESKSAEAIIQKIEVLEQQLDKEINKASDKIKELCQKEIDKKVDSPKWGWNRGDERDTGKISFFGEKDDKDSGERNWESELQAEYWREKTSLLSQIKYLDERGELKSESILQEKKKELEQHITYGKSDGVRDTARPDYKRQVSIFDPQDFQQVEITIAGLGNIGSHTALALTRMGLKNFHLYDFDVIEEHNLSSQAYGISQVGMPKIDALSALMTALNPDVRVWADYVPFTGKEQVGSILISAVDSMAARRTICGNLPSDTFVFDGRMGGGQIEVHSQAQPDWGKTLEVDGDEDPCGARFISYTSYIIAGLIANNVKRYLMKQKFHNRILFHADTLDLIKV